MAFEKIVGMISDVHLKSKPKKDSNGNVTGKEYTWAFRIGNRQAFLNNTGEYANFTDGDEVIAVGEIQRNGSFNIWTIRNETSETVYKNGDGSQFFNSSIGNYILGVVIILVGICIIFQNGIYMAFQKGHNELFFGIPVVAFGLLFLWLGYKHSIVEKMLRQHTT